MQVNDGAQVMFLSPVDGIDHQVPSLGQLVTLFVPELHLVNGQAYEVEAQLCQTLEVVLLNVLATGLTPLFRLRQPMTDVGTALDAEVVYIVCLTLCAAGGKAQHRHGYHSQGNECLFHYCVFLFILFSYFLPQTSYFLPSIIPCRIQGAFTFMLALRSNMPKCSGPLPKVLLSQMKVEMPRFSVSLIRNLQ